MKQFLIQFALFAAATCSVVSAAQAQSVKSLKVELLIFSGRPNPTFVITDPRDIHDILDTAKNLPQNEQIKDAEKAAPQPRLGYQGFMVTNESDDSTEVKSVQVRGSAVHLALRGADAKGKSTQHSARVDRGNFLESKLLSHGRDTGVIDDKLLDAIESSR
jgi:hypothetical protein